MDLTTEEGVLCLFLPGGDGVTTKSTTVMVAVAMALKVEVDTAMVVAVALAKAVAVGDHGCGHGWRSGRDVARERWESWTAARPSCHGPPDATAKV